ncbi:MAG: polysaccharide export protein [Pseudomonadaceae bacterium]|nr:polysaccharide export protein [Pseudomonadaceae bacterium]
MSLRHVCLAAALLLAPLAHADDVPDFSQGFTGGGARLNLPAGNWHERNDAVARAAEGAQAATAPRGVNTAGGYTLGAGDKVKMTVFGEDDLSGEFEVDGTGMLALPLIGELHVGGMTPRGAEQAIADRLSQGYLVNPRVNLEVMNFRPFFILGEVNKPGSYPYVNDMTVISAVALAGGYTARAATGHVFVKRAADAARREVELPEDAKIFPGDIIRVDERFF